MVRQLIWQYGAMAVACVSWIATGCEIEEPTTFEKAVGEVLYCDVYKYQLVSCGLLLTDWLSSGKRRWNKGSLGGMVDQHDLFARYAELKF